MANQESRRATAEARRAVGRSTAPVSLPETTTYRYLSATAYVTEAAPQRDEVRLIDPEPEAARSDEHSTGNTNPVLVGIDGSGCARQAAEWAAQEATRRRTSLRLIHAYHLPPAGTSGYNPYPPHLLTDLREGGGAILYDTAQSLQRSHPDLAIDTSLVYGDPATVLRHAAASAALVVLGSHGGPRVKVAVGSVAGAVAATSPSPVAVIHTGSVPTAGPVVVGVDGSPESRAAIACAFQLAEERRSPLLAAHCWTGPQGGGFDSAPGPQEQELLDRELADWVRRYPEVPVEQTLIHDQPAAGLLGLSETAQLIVAGSRGRRGLTSLILGSTSQALIAQSRCPVVIARPTGA